MSPNSKVLGGFPAEMKVTLKYVETIALDPGAGSLAAYEFDPRNMYDPNVTGTGHQPSNFDRWTTIYNTWSVHQTRFSVSNAFNSTSGVQPGIFGFLVSKSGSQVTGFSSLETLIEQPYVKYSAVPTGLLQNVPFSTVVSATLKSAPWLGVTRRILNTPDYAGDGSSGPAETFKVEVFLGAINGNDPGSCSLRVEILFDAVFYEPKITLPS